MSADELREAISVWCAENALDCETSKGADETVTAEIELGRVVFALRADEWTAVGSHGPLRGANSVRTTARRMCRDLGIK